MRNATIVDLLRRYAGTLRIRDENRFKVKAYERAATSIELLDFSVSDLLAQGKRLDELPGIGKAISAMIQKIVETGTLPALESLTSTLSPELLELSGRPSLDPKLVLRVYKKLGINTLDKLATKLNSGEVERALGPRIAFQIRVGLDERPRMLLWKAEPIAKKILHYLESLPEVTRAAVIGSLRRKKDTVADLGFLVSGMSSAKIFKRFAAFSGVQRVYPRGKYFTEFLLASGIRISILWSRPDQWGLSILFGTGSADHLEDLKHHAKKHRLSLSASSPTNAKVKAKTEEEIYGQCGLPYIEPELREGCGEIEAAERNKLPELVRMENIRGDLHTHSTSSDGANTIGEMAAAAKTRGYTYIGITDHSQSLKIARGVSEKDLAKQLDAIDKLNTTLRGIFVLKSAEVDILEDGSLDYPDWLLEQLDFTICSIHSLFRLNKSQQTTRILRAMDNRYFNILGHATGRLLLRREGYQVDFERIVSHAKDTSSMFEINANPNRLDLSDEHARMVKEAGVLIAINTDAHSVAELDFISAGLNQARRAWLEPRNVLNTLTIKQLRKVLRR